MDGKKKENVVKGGPSTLRKMLKLKYPSLSLNELSKLILKIKENHGRSLTGLQFGDILKLIKIEIEKDSQTDTHCNVELKENAEKMRPIKLLKNPANIVTKYFYTGGHSKDM